MKQRAHIFYSGRVQGVGFRYTVYDIASDNGLTGWVRNRRDRRVEILIEGKKEDIEKLMDRIQSYFENSIDKKEVVYQISQDEFQDFQIAPTL